MNSFDCNVLQNFPPNNVARFLLCETCDKQARLSGGPATLLVLEVPISYSAATPRYLTAPQPSTHSKWLLGQEQSKALHHPIVFISALLRRLLSNHACISL